MNIQQQQTKVDQILDYWFGTVNQTTLPSQRRAQLWFGINEKITATIQKKFEQDIIRARLGHYDDWIEEPRSALALILLLDQFPRKVYHVTSAAYSSDNKALEICLKGLQSNSIAQLNLIERVFFLMPLVHTENLKTQYESIRQYEQLMKLSMPEFRNVYENFFEYAAYHFKVIERFSRFPDRNLAMGRDSSISEKEFLKKLGQ